MGKRRSIYDPTVDDEKVLKHSSHHNDNDQDDEDSDSTEDNSSIEPDEDRKVLKDLPGGIFRDPKARGNPNDDLDLYSQHVVRMMEGEEVLGRSTSNNKHSGKSRRSKLLFCLLIGSLLVVTAIITISVVSSKNNDSNSKNPAPFKNNLRSHTNNDDDSYDDEGGDDYDEDDDDEDDDDDDGVEEVEWEEDDNEDDYEEDEDDNEEDLSEPQSDMDDDDDGNYKSSVDVVLARNIDSECTYGKIAHNAVSRRKCIQTCEPGSCCFSSTSSYKTTGLVNGICGDVSTGEQIMCSVYAGCTILLDGSLPELLPGSSTTTSNTQSTPPATTTTTTTNNPPPQTTSTAGSFPATTTTTTHHIPTSTIDNVLTRNIAFECAYDRVATSVAFRNMCVQTCEPASCCFLREGGDDHGICKDDVELCELYVGCSILHNGSLPPLPQQKGSDAAPTTTTTTTTNASTPTTTTSAPPQPATTTATTTPPPPQTATTTTTGNADVVTAEEDLLKGVQDGNIVHEDVSDHEQYIKINNALTQAIAFECTYDKIAFDQLGRNLCLETCESGACCFYNEGKGEWHGNCSDGTHDNDKKFCLQYVGCQVIYDGLNAGTLPELPAVSDPGKP